MKLESIAQVHQIVEKHQTDNSVFLVDLTEVRNKFSLWMRQLPNIMPYYAVKCNNDPKILSCLSEMGPDITGTVQQFTLHEVDKIITEILSISMISEKGCGFDAASKVEMQEVSKLVSPGHIIFAQTCKIAAHIEFARTKDIAMMTFDSISELQKIKRTYPGAKGN